MAMRKSSTRGKFLCVGILALLLFAAVLAGCNAKEKSTADSADGKVTLEYSSLEQLDGKPIGGIVGSVNEQFVRKKVANPQYKYFNASADQIAALDSGKVDAVAQDKPAAMQALQQNAGFGIIPEVVSENNYAIALQKNSPLTAQVNAAIATLKEDGTLAAMEEKWFGTDESVQVLPQLTYPGEKGILRLAHDTSQVPMTYLNKDGDPAGFDLELILRIGQLLDYKVEFIPVDFAGIIPMLKSDKADAAVGCITITEERQAELDLSDPYYEGGIYMLVRTTAHTTKSLWDSLVSGFTLTFLAGDRWMIILRGLGTTLLISFGAGSLGLLMGFGLCMLRRSRNRLANAPAAALIRIMQGTPVAVFLMILYYIVFKSVDISAVFVAIIAFSINFAVYSGEMMRSGLNTVDIGQIEASYALGFNKYQTFWKVSFPQAARHFLPLLKGEFISMIKMTSVAGFIAVQDLTKAGDIIRGSTMEPFFPLLTTALLYFLISNILFILLERLEISLDPKQRPHTLKGVVIK
ncbi:MAG: ABC transporter substrate-binding protein/permease [Oscillospiraceae bacterium]